MTTLTLDDIKKSIIHRHENLLLDSVTLQNPKSFSGTLSLCISDNDPLNRDIFLKESPSGHYVLSTPFYMEILALSSIVSSGKLKPGEAAVFAGISNFSISGHYHQGDSLSGSVERISAKKSFLKYKGELQSNNTPIAQGNMTAFFSTINFNTSEPPSPDIDTLPTNTNLPTKKINSNKPNTMILSDTLSYIDEPNNTFISTYSYPNDHPLIKGHFPKNPIMMGVMQWATLEDALCSYLSHTQTTGTHTWTCNALIYNQHKVLVSTIRNCTLKSWINISGIKNQAEIQSTQRIMFKNMVKPGDTLYTHITDLKKQ